MCGHNEASGGFSFFEGLTYNYMKKQNQQPLGFNSSKVCKYFFCPNLTSYLDKPKRSICSRMSRSTKGDREQATNKHQDTLLSQFSWNKMKERSQSCSIMNEQKGGYKRQAPFSELCIDANQEILGSQHCK
jgi:hypothetical protein